MRHPALGFALLISLQPLYVHATGRGPLTLCDLIENSAAYNHQEVRVRAIYAIGAEQAVLYDPRCRGGKPLTYVEFAKSVRTMKKGRQLEKIISKQRRAAVEFEGIFYGPEPAVADPRMADEVRRRVEHSVKRYGHMDSLDTKITVSTILKVAEPPANIP